MTRRSRWILLLLVVSFVAIAGCRWSPKVESRLLDTSGNVVLYVSNQSFAIDPIDIRIELDGECVVHQYFHVKNQHNWIPFTLRLAEGTHQIVVQSKKGSASLRETLEVKGKHWAVVNYWYSPKSDYKSTPQFSFKIQDKPILFL